MVERDKDVGRSRHDDVVPAGRQQVGAHLPGHRQHHAFLRNTADNRAGINPAVPRIDHDDGLCVESGGGGRQLFVSRGLQCRPHLRPLGLYGRFEGRCVGRREVDHELQGLPPLPTGQLRPLNLRRRGQIQHHPRLPGRKQPVPPGCHQSVRGRHLGGGELELKVGDIDNHPSRIGEHENGRPDRAADIECNARALLVAGKARRYDAHRNRRLRRASDRLRRRMAGLTAPGLGAGSR